MINVEMCDNCIHYLFPGMKTGGKQQAPGCIFLFRTFHFLITTRAQYK